MDSSESGLSSTTKIRRGGEAVDDPSRVLVPPRAAYLPQVPRLFSEPLADTILLGEPADDLDHALWLTCLDEDLASMPHGTATLIGPRGLRLSGGQIQRAGAARALVRRPELLVVDGGAVGEPAGSEGVANLTARALLEGTARRSGIELAERFELLGATVETGADWDSTTFAMAG